jgi:hypothetical protein
LDRRIIHSRTFKDRRHRPIRRVFRMLVEKANALSARPASGSTFEILIP